MPTERWARAVVVAMALSACEPEVLPPFVTPLDSGSERPDAGPVVVLPDAGRDGGPDAGGGALDAGDAGESRTPPVVDGMIGDAEWEGAFVASSSTTPLEPFVGDRLERVRAIRTRDRLYVAIEGRLGPDHALVLLLDDDSGGDEGLVLTGEGLSDFDGALDRIVSAPSWTSTLPDFRPEYAWGTTMVPFARGGGDADSGWREIARRFGAFEWLGNETVSACSIDACETSFALEGLDARELALMVRIGRADGLLSNQTLPMDDPFFPETISQVMRIPLP